MSTYESIRGEFVDGVPSETPEQEQGEDGNKKESLETDESEDESEDENSEDIEDSDECGTLSKGRLSPREADTHQSSSGVNGCLIPSQPSLEVRKIMVNGEERAVIIDDWDSHQRISQIRRERIALDKQDNFIDRYSRQGELNMESDSREESFYTSISNRDGDECQFSEQPPSPNQIQTAETDNTINPDHFEIPETTEGPRQTQIFTFANRLETMAKENEEKILPSMEERECKEAEMAQRRDKEVAREKEASRFKFKQYDAGEYWTAQEKAYIALRSKTEEQGNVQEARPSWDTYMPLDIDWERESRIPTSAAERNSLQEPQACVRSDIREEFLKIDKDLENSEASKLPSPIHGAQQMCSKQETSCEYPTRTLSFALVQPQNLNDCKPAASPSAPSTPLAIPQIQQPPMLSTSTQTETPPVVDLQAISRYINWLQAENLRLTQAQTLAPQGVDFPAINNYINALQAEKAKMQAGNERLESEILNLKSRNEWLENEYTLLRNTVYVEPDVDLGNGSHIKSLQEEKAILQSQLTNLIKDHLRLVNFTINKSNETPSISEVNLKPTPSKEQPVEPKGEVEQDIVVKQEPKTQKKIVDQCAEQWEADEGLIGQALAEQARIKRKLAENACIEEEMEGKRIDMERKLKLKKAHVRSDKSARYVAKSPGEMEREKRALMDEAMIKLENLKRDIASRLLAQQALAQEEKSVEQKQPKIEEQASELDGILKFDLESDNDEDWDLCSTTSETLKPGAVNAPKTLELMKPSSSKDNVSDTPEQSTAGSPSAPEPNPKPKWIAPPPQPPTPLMKINAIFTGLCPESLHSENGCPYPTCTLKKICLLLYTTTSPDCGDPQCKDVHIKRTCELEAEGKECYVRGWGMHWGTHYRERMHKADCGADEWAKRMAVARLRREHEKGVYGCRKN